jgi:hypothetical protein
MKTLKVAALAILMIAGSAIAQDEIERNIEVKVIVDDDGSGDMSAIHWASKGMDFDMQDMAVGETRNIDSESGKAISVTRTEDGFSFDIDGKTIDMPGMGGYGTRMAFLDTDGPGENIEIDVMGGLHKMRPHMADGVTIVSSTPLDDSVRESIKSVLISAGNDDEVTFIDRSQGGKRVFMMKKQVEVVE